MGKCRQFEASSGVLLSLTFSGSVCTITDATSHLQPSSVRCIGATHNEISHKRVHSLRIDRGVDPILSISVVGAAEG